MGHIVSVVVAVSRHGIVALFFAHQLYNSRLRRFIDAAAMEVTRVR